jgi:putative ABC transport system permease protein
LGEFHLTPSVLLFQAALAILVPLGAGLIPILSGTRVTVREAITNYGVSANNFGGSRLDRFIKGLTRLPAPLALSVRNTFRSKGRLILTLTTLALAGTSFMAVMNVRTSLQQTVADILDYWAYDISVDFNQPYRLNRLAPIVASVPGVEAVEGWATGATYRIRPDGSESKDIYLQAPPANSQMINPQLLEGRWLTPDDGNALVVSANFLTAEPDVKVGDEIVLKINDEETTWQVVGVVRFAQAVSLAYMNYERLAPLIGTPGRVASLRITTDRHDPAARSEIAAALQARLTEAGLDVGAVQTISQARAAIDVLANIVITFLMSMAVLLAVVGGIGLAGTMSLNVLERIREVGVLRAIGAGNGAVLRVVIFEGVLIGWLSWGIGAILALPVGKVIADAVGKATLGSTLNYTVSLTGVFLWFGLVTGLAALASYFPAQQAANLSVRQVLNYEQ